MISVTDRVFTAEEIAREVQYHPADSLDVARHEAGVALVVRELLLQRANELNLDPAGDEDQSSDERLITALLEREIEVPVPDESTCRRYFETNAERFRSPDIFEASHILFPADAQDARRRTEAREAAQKTLDELNEHPDSFEQLAKERSADSATASQGGHLGQVTKGQTTPEFEACLYRLQAGEICDTPVATRYGYHIIRLDRVAKGRPLTYSMAKEKIQEYLSASAWNRAVHQYIQLLAGKAHIEGIDIEGATTPLVQ